MQPHDFFLILLLILLGARLFAELFRKLSLPPVLGELLAGIVMGPSLLGWVEPTATIKLLAEIGIILLLFDVGLETDLQRLKQSGKNAAIVAIGGFLLPFFLGAWVSYEIFSLPLIVSLFIGGTVTATSIGITIRVLGDLKRRNSEEGEIVLGAAVLDDIFGVLLLTILYEFSRSGSIDLANTAKVFVFIILFFVTAPIAAKLLATLIQKYDDRGEREGLIATAIFSMVLFFGWIAHKVGAPEIIGGFAAGLALSRRFLLPFGIALRESGTFADKIENQVRPIVYLFTPIFFVTVGLSMNMREIAWTEAHVWLFGGTLLAVSILGKMAAPLLLSELAPAKRVIVGLSMIPRGEVGLIFAEIGSTAGLFDNETYAAIILVIVLTTLIPPFFIKLVYSKWIGVG